MLYRAYIWDIHRAMLFFCEGFCFCAAAVCNIKFFSPLIVSRRLPGCMVEKIFIFIQNNQLLKVFQLLIWGLSTFFTRNWGCWDSLSGKYFLEDALKLIFIINNLEDVQKFNLHFWKYFLPLNTVKWPVHPKILSIAANKILKCLNACSKITMI